MRVNLMKKLLTMTSAAALLVGLGMAPALANPTLKNTGGDAYDLVDIYADDFYNNGDVYIEAYNVAVLSENDQWGEVYDPYVYVYDDLYTGDIDFDGDVQYLAAGQFAQVFNTGLQNVNQAAASIAATAEFSFD